MIRNASNVLADNVRQLRAMRGLTQAQLAKSAEIPRATWAHLESGGGNPTLAVLTAVATALQVTLEELVAPPRASVRHYKAAELKSRVRQRVTVRKLLPDPLPGLDLERMELPAGARMTGTPHQAGTREYLTCERGVLILAAAGQRWTLEAGDVVVFRGDQPHSYHNESMHLTVGYSAIVLGAGTRE